MNSPHASDPREQIETWLRYYEEIGLRSFYRDRVAASAPTSSIVVPPKEEMTPQKKTIASTPAVAAASATASAAKIAVLPIAQGPSLFEAADRVEGDTLERTREDLGECTRCKLHKHRNKIVFGAGSAKAELVFVGEGPGRDEDAQGLPFVGRAGKLLTQMIEAMGLKREEVYICNIVKCRPPENRQPEKDEVAACSPFLFRQLAAIQPKVICCLGTVAAQTLLGTNKGISHFRGEWFDFRGSKLIATYHPAYLLRNPNAKGEVWMDLKKVMTVLGLNPRKK
jgi:DNA polymerase